MEERERELVEKMKYGYIVGIKVLLLVMNLQQNWFSKSKPQEKRKKKKLWT